MRRILKALKLWVADERMVLNELEYVLHEAGKHLYQGRSSIQHYPVPTATPTQLLPAACPDKSKWGDFIPNPDYWAEWLARWLVLCLPRQEELQNRVLQETSLWART
ncbi:hypothetical protein H7849_18995 [Alloacidobacterium dinghuense]|uniref:Uncharacterized protein n=1 Tax=Alloacidobacterium dinghuense TaxID=2763107 RepID=A0A7G8BF44_9BACT|nr:hypothetical protein [Alloacidobacterium dinghuense]QNI31164.1 hypothetical protein H7849_18995 [Alloacidobacterium dinghuense]